MHDHGIRRLAIVLLAIFSISAISLHADEDMVKAKHLGVASCANSVCHGRAAPAEQGNILQNEYRTWAKYDHHSKAYSILKNADSKRIAANMGLADASKEAQCLACHADTTPVALQGEKFQIEDGIGCEVCHGGAEKWIDSHYGANTAASHQENLNKGLLPTEDPVFAAKLCQSCHLGNTNQLANHEMMAAGHPRLRFELDTWLTLMPPHHRDDADYQQRGKSSTALARWLEGRMRAAHDYLALLEQHSSPQGLFPELAVFDCHSCHRPMNTDVERTLADKQALPAGSIRSNDNTLRILAAIVSVRNKALGKEFYLAIYRLNRASVLSAKDLQEKSRQLTAIITKAQESLRQPALTENEQKSIAIALLKQAANGNIRDYADAEQLFLGLQLLAYNDKNPQESAKRYDDIFKVLDDEKRYNPNKFKVAAQKTLRATTE
jgi:hypothetical protein